MDLKDVTGTFARRWYLAIPVMILAMVAAFGIFTKIGASYTSTASLVLIPPDSVVNSDLQSSLSQPVHNPLLYLGGLAAPRDVVIASLSTTSFEDEMLAKYDATVLLTPLANSAAPIIVVQVTGKNGSVTNSGLQYVVASIPAKIQALQRSLKIDQKNDISVQKLAVEVSSTISHKGQIEYTAAAFLFLMTAGGLAIAVLDALWQRPRRRKRTRTQSKSATSNPETRASRRASKRRPVDAIVPNGDMPEPEGVGVTNEADGGGLVQRGVPVR